MADNLARRIEGYLARLQARQMSPHTLSAYRRDLGKLQHWMQSEGIEHFADLSADRLRGLIASEHRAGLAPKSLHRLLSACRGLFRDLVREGELGGDPSAGLRAPKLRRKLPEVLDADEARALVELPGDDVLAVRDHAMLELLYSSGLRLAELAALRWGDIDLADGRARAFYTVMA
ncbi:MAG: site-specific integrase, partial [Xanthomonadales bacterium]|nr:site-specific integrase [Xanthomonadales bacterium]